MKDRPRPNRQPADRAWDAAWRSLQAGADSFEMSWLIQTEKVKAHELVIAHRDDANRFQERIIEQLNRRVNILSDENTELKMELFSLKNAQKSADTFQQNMKEQSRRHQSALYISVEAQDTDRQAEKGQSIIPATSEKPKDKPRIDDWIEDTTRALGIEKSLKPSKNTNFQLPLSISEYRVPTTGTTNLKNAQNMGTPQAPKNKPDIVNATFLLGFIKGLEFSSEDIKQIPIFKSSDTQIIMFRDVELDTSNDKKLTREYFVRMGETQPHLGMRYRLSTWKHGRYYGVHHSINQKDAFEGTVLKLETKFKDISSSDRGVDDTYRRFAPDRTKARRVDKPTLPRYVYEIGELCVRTHDHTKDVVEAPRSTYCHVVVDVLSEKKALWLVYRYKGVECNNQMVTRRRKFVRDDDMFRFVEDDQDFDFCKLAESMGDWLMNNGKFRIMRDALGLIKSTHYRADPEFAAPVYEEFLQDINKGRAQGS